MNSAFLDPQPFRDWYAGQKEHHEAEEIARWFGVDSRTLRRWDEDSDRIRRGEFEDALMRSHFSLWDIYPDLEEVAGERTHGYCTGCKEDVPVGVQLDCLWCGTRTWRKKSGVDPRLQSKVTDDQLRSLYSLHEGGASVRELARRSFKAIGYLSVGSAEKGINRGFTRLGLPILTKPGASHRRCLGVKSWWPDKGRRCSRTPMLGSDYCREHDPERRGEVVAHMLRAKGLSGEAA